ncbi:hypothetical protein ACNKHK_14525 [Shigella flexneri]
MRSSLRDGRVLILVNAFVVKRLPSPTLPATPIPSFRSGIGWQQPGRARRLSAAVGAADERLDVAVAVSASVRRRTLSPASGGDGDGQRWLSLFIPFTSNPFARTLPNFPIEGRDLNPLLQDPGEFSIRRCCTWGMSVSPWPLRLRLPR